MSKTNRLSVVKISDILFSETNPRGPIKEETLSELIQSIKDKGVIQPILVRTFEKDQYQLVCGERRLRSAILAGLKEIPVNIRELSDDEAYELQIIENLEREDLHPMEEALSFEKLIDKNISIADIAGKIAKKESFVAQRLSLLNLTKPIQKDFRNGHLGISHALLLARNSSKIQKEIRDKAIGWDGDNKKNPDYGTVAKLKEKLSRALPELKDFPFDINDADLYKKAGACSVCPKRNFSNPLLFEDDMKTDKCLDIACSLKKKDLYIVQRVTEIIEGNMDIHLCLAYSQEPLNEKVAKLCEEHKIKLLKEYDDFKDRSPSWDKEKYRKAKGIYIIGDDIGKEINIWIKKTAKDKLAEKVEPGTPAAKNQALKEQIAGIDTRANRALELDAEKVWKKVINFEDKSKFLDNDKPLNSVEKKALFMSLDLEWRSKVKAEFTVSVKDVLEKELPDALLNKVFRHFINSKLTKSYGSHKTQPDNLLYKTILESYYPKEIAVIDKEQKDIADKRIERTKVRVATLKSKMVIEKAKDNVEKAKKAITEKKAPAKKKSVAKKTDAVKKVVKEFSEQKGVNADHVNDKVKVVTINS